jgi:hypothetical protein
MNLSPGYLMASMLVSTVGFGLFVYGKKQSRLPQLVTGIALMVYPLFVASVAWMLGIAGALIGAMWLTTRHGA